MMETIPECELPTLDLKARRILGKNRTKHFRPMVMNFSTKSVIPTTQIRSKKS